MAELIGADHDEVVLVPNTTHGLNTILRNIEWRQGDIILNSKLPAVIVYYLLSMTILIASITYNAVERTAQYLSDRSEPPHPTLHAVEYTFPMSHADIVKAFRAKIHVLKAAHPNTKFDILASDINLDGKNNRFVAIIDSIASNPGVYLPWKEMVKVCKEEGVWAVIDAAHSIGQEVGLQMHPYASL